ncbi:MAG TPA: DUF3149 domain-containing protein [Burkholderiaceae bacterium]|jgi:hypothetical protein|nr:DUF3149 domain-containing protein [Burkholderiaceae bacterium]HPE02325.1 DUF3149 domain-containing protein [Burkholderiaceae bacterium]HRZ00429.1 DUF3149 domain-containing protein [Burkholderiaceae bacterium]
MGALRELFTTPVGLLSLGTILFVIYMGFWFNRFFAKKIAESQPPADAPPPQAPN